MNDKAPVTDSEIAKTLSLKPQLPKPFVLAVYFKEPTFERRTLNQKWRWTDEDEQTILSSLDNLKKNGELAAIIPISDAVVSGQDIKSLRLAAAHYGADALMVVTGTSDRDSYENNWGWTYIALVTAFFVPASVNDVLFIADATLWDVRNGYLYAAANAESISRETHPAVFVDVKEQVNHAKTDTLNQLRNEFLKRMNTITHKTPDIGGD
jgi:hypothetical protein